VTSRVSTIIPTYNNAATIAEAIDSALAQDFEGQEIIIVNDGATDGTPAILASYGERIRTVEQRNRGYNRSRNAGIALARSEYIAFLDADDIWLPGRLARTCAALDRNPNAVLAFTDMIPMDEQGELGTPWAVGPAPTLSDLLTYRWRIYPSAVTIRREILEACGRFSEELTNLSDSYLWMRARELGSFEYLTEPMVIYRTIDFRRIGDKCQGFARFARVVRHHYGRAARPVIAQLAESLAGSLVAKAVMQRDRREFLPACRSIVRATWLSPRYLFKYGLVLHLFGLSNLRRIVGTSSTAPRHGE
jgi:glycosyltransferase involved in cell wall biosynthesis